MDLLEESQMTRAEEKAHWWIRTRFLYLNQVTCKALRRFTRISILEMGCGTAQNLAYLREDFQQTKQIDHLHGIEPGLSAAQGQYPWLLPHDSVLRSVADFDAASHKTGFHLVISMDVLEHIHDDTAALKEWITMLAPNGIVFITVPAFTWLWSRHDVILGHKRRYTIKSLKALAENAGLKPIKTGYIFGYTLPLVYLIRRILPRFYTEKETQASNLQKTHALANIILTMFGWLEYLLGGNPFFGSSVFGVFEKEPLRADP